MGILLTVIGVLLLLVCLAGVATGVYMATDGRNREPGALFALCWVAGAAGALGVAMRDPVTFLVGTVCFLVAGSVFFLFGGAKPASGRQHRPGPRREAPEGSEDTTKENQRSGYRRAAS